jgi:hypothetical protein
MGDTSCAIRVMMNVILDVISGRTANDVSPISPRVKLEIARSFLISNPSVDATNISADVYVIHYDVSLRDQEMNREPKSSVPSMHDKGPFGTGTTSPQQPESDQAL